MKKILAHDYWNKLLLNCIIESNTIPTEFYYLITNNKTLQKYINNEVIHEFLSNPENIKLLIEEICYVKRIDTNYITQSINTNDIEDIIKQIYNVQYINDDYVLIERRKSNE